MDTSEARIACRANKITPTGGGDRTIVNTQPALLQRPLESLKKQLLMDASDFTVKRGVRKFFARCLYCSKNYFKLRFEFDLWSARTL